MDITTLVLAGIHVSLPILGLLLLALRQERLAHARMLRSTIREVTLRRTTRRPPR